MQPKTVNTAFNALDPLLVQLQQNLQTAMNNDPNHYLTVNATTLGTAGTAIITLMQSALGINSYTLTANITITPDDSANTLTVTGDTDDTIINIDSATLTAVFSVQQQALIIELNIPAQDPWKFTDTFPAFTKSRLLPLSFVNSDTVWPVFILSSIQRKVTNGQLAAGLNLSAQVNLQAPFDSLLKLIPGAANPLPVLGPVTASDPVTTSVDLQCSVPAFTLQLPGMQSLVFNQPTFSINGLSTVYNDIPYLQTDCFVTANITLNGHTLTLAARLPVGGTLPQLLLPPKQSLPLSLITGFFTSLFTSDVSNLLTAALPPYLNTLTDKFSLKGFVITLLPGWNGFTNIKFAIASNTNGAALWPLIPNIFELQEAAISLQIKTQTGKGPYTITGRIGGSVNVGTQLTIGAVVPLPINATAWVFTANTNNAIPDLGQFAQFLGGNNLGTLLPANLKEVGGFSLTDLMVTWQPTTHTFTTFGLTLTTNNTWTIIPNWFLVKQLYLQIQIASPLTTAQLTGTFSGTLVIGSIGVDVSIVKAIPTGDWILSVVTETITLPRLDDMTQLLGGTQLVNVLPASIVQNHFQLENLHINIDISQQKLNFLSFQLDSPDNWNIITGLLSVSQPGIALQFDWSNGGNLVMTGRLYGDLIFAGADFYVTADKNADGWDLSASLGDDSSLYLFKVIDALSPNTSQELASLGIHDIVLSAAAIAYHTKDGTFSIDATLTYNGDAGNFHLVGKDTGGQWQFIAMIGFDLNPAFDAGAHIPLVGDELKGYLTLNKGYLIITSESPQGLTLSGAPKNITPGVSFYFDVELIGDDTPVTLPLLAYSSYFNAEVNRFHYPGKDTGMGPGNATYTINIGKNLGPVYIDSIALTYTDQHIYCAITAAMTIGPFNASLEGASIGTSIDAFSPSFRLNGIGFDFTSASFTIDGALLRIPDNLLGKGVSFQYDGALIIKMEQSGLSALGSYAQMSDGTASFFIFLNADFPPGGPPFFMVSGLMGGFGYNRTLTLPAFNQVQDFPLMALDAPSTDSQKDLALHTLSVLEGQAAGKNGTTTTWISPRTGDYWVAAGLAFNSFEIINGKLLLTAELGRDMQFSLLGLSWLTLPQSAVNGEWLVFLELQMSAVLQPDEGFLGLAASLTSNSYVLTKDCHITGGFAFYLWFGDSPNTGQFVVTAGGYHPAFKPPDYYPEVARLGFNWQVSGDVSIKGGSYFAFTPSCAMAGGRLQAQYQSGPLRAWFDAGANFLVTWHPLTFVADIWIEIGVSLTVHVWFVHKTLSASVGASLHMWGPPIGGIVRVHVVFVTFKIRFGSDGAQDKNTQPLAWDDFKKMLPSAPDRCIIIANSGLTQILEKDTKGNIVYNGDTPGSPTTKVWFLRAGKLQFTTKSMIPATRLTYGNGSQQLVNGPQNISIRPMNITNITAVHNVCITKDSQSGTPIAIDGWTFTANQGNVATTLWGQPIIENNQFVQAPSTPSADTVGDQLTGYTVTGPEPEIGDTFGIVSMRLLLNEYIDQNDNPQNPLSKAHASSNDFAPYTSSTTLTDIGTIGTGLGAARNALYTELQQDKLYTGGNDNMLQMGATANSLFVDIPMEQSN